MIRLENEEMRLWLRMRLVCLVWYYFAGPARLFVLVLITERHISFIADLKNNVSLDAFEEESNLLLPPLETLNLLSVPSAIWWEHSNDFLNLYFYATSSIVYTTPTRWSSNTAQVLRKSNEPSDTPETLEVLSVV